MASRKFISPDHAVAGRDGDRCDGIVVVNGGRFAGMAGIIRFAQLHYLIHAAINLYAVRQTDITRQGGTRLQPGQYGLVTVLSGEAGEMACIGVGVCDRGRNSCGPCRQTCHENGGNKSKEGLHSPFLI